MDIFVRGVGVGLAHTENLLIKKLRIARETGDLEAETGEDPKKPDIGRVVESYFNLPNEFLSSLLREGCVVSCGVEFRDLVAFRKLSAAELMSWLEILVLEILGWKYCVELRCDKEIRLTNRQRFLTHK